MTKHKNYECDKTPNLAKQKKNKFYNSKTKNATKETQNVTKLKNSECDKTKKLKYDKTQKQKMQKKKKSKCENTKKLKMGQKSKTQNGHTVLFVLCSMRLLWQH